MTILIGDYVIHDKAYAFLKKPTEQEISETKNYIAELKESCKLAIESGYSIDHVSERVGDIDEMADELRASNDFYLAEELSDFVKSEINEMIHESAPENRYFSAVKNAGIKLHESFDISQDYIKQTRAYDLVKQGISKTPLLNKCGKAIRKHGLHAVVIGGVVLACVGTAGCVGGDDVSYVSGDYNVNKVITLDGYMDISEKKFMNDVSIYPLSFNDHRAFDKSIYSNQGIDFLDEAYVALIGNDLYIFHDSSPEVVERLHASGDKAGIVTK